MRFADPYFFVLLLAIPALLFLRLRLARRQAGAWFSNVALFAGFRPTWRVRLRWVPTAARALALALVVAALARPQTGRAENELPGRGIDIALVFDTSSSMSTSFGKDSRLVAAQRVITEFIGGRQEDRIGLVIFRSESLVLSPLTLDYDALKRLVGDAQRVNLSDGTAIGLGLAEGLNLLRESHARSRVAILLTDGQNNDRTLDPLAAARIAETLGIRVYTIGVLDSRPRPGQPSNVDEQALRQMAEVTGGHYYGAESEEALASIYDSIDRLEKSHVGRAQFAAYDELGVYFVSAGVLLLALEVATATTIWRRAA